MSDSTPSERRTPRCPTCGDALVKRLGDFAAWECPGGHGMAATLPVARQQVAHATVGEVWQRSAKEPPGERSCPFCTRAMVPVEVAVSPVVPPVRLDLCRVDHLVWFDPGDIEALPPRSAADDAAPTPIIVNHWDKATEDLQVGPWTRRITTWGF